MNPATLSQTITLGNKKEILEILQDEKIDLNVICAHGNTVLHLIIKNKKFKEYAIELFQAALSRGVDPNIEDNKGLTVIHLAVASRRRDIIDLLIKHKADVSMCDEKGNTIAHYFVESENTEFFIKLYQCTDSEYIIEQIVEERASFAEWLISKGFDFDRRNKKDQSALDLSIEYNLKHITFALLKHSKNTNVIDNQGLAILDKLFELNNKYRHNDYLVYHVYSYLYTSKVIKLLLSKGVATKAKMIDQLWTPLQKAIMCQEDQRIIKLLVDHRMKSWDKRTATEMIVELLEICNFWGDFITDYLLSLLHTLTTDGAELNSKDNNGMAPLHYAFYNRNMDAIKFLINQCDIDFSTTTNLNENLFHLLAKKNTHLKQASSNGSTTTDDHQNYTKPITDEELMTILQLIVDKNCCDVNAKNRDGDTPLHLATKYHSLMTVQMLIQCGANVNCKNKLGQTPLHLAINRQSKKLAQLLIDNGTNVNAKDSTGMRPLYYAAANKCKLLLLLLKHGAYVNTYDFLDLTLSEVLECCANHCNYHWADNMLAYGADIHRSSTLFFVKDICRARLDGENYEECDYIAIGIVLNHWIKLDVAGLPCSKVYKSYVWEARGVQCPSLSYKEFQEEVAILKNTFIDTDISIYSFLHMNFGRRRSYINNEKLKNLVDLGSKQFKWYHVIICASYRLTLQWIELLEPAKEAWRELTKLAGFPRLVDDCIETVFAHLRVEDLVSLIEYKDDR